MLGSCCARYSPNLECTSCLCLVVIWTFINCLLSSVSSLYVKFFTIRCVESNHIDTLLHVNTSQCNCWIVSIVTINFRFDNDVIQLMDTVITGSQEIDTCCICTPILRKCIGTFLQEFVCKRVLNLVCCSACVDININGEEIEGLLLKSNYVVLIIVDEEVKLRNRFVIKISTTTCALLLSKCKQPVSLLSCTHLAIVHLTCRIGENTNLVREL